MMGRRMGFRAHRLAVPALVAALALGGCGGGGSERERERAVSTDRQDERSEGGGGARAGALSSAATLRSTLTGLLTDHAFLAGFAMNTGLAQGFDSPSFASADGALDANARQLGRQLRAVFGRAAQARFLAAWRAQNDAYAQAASARATGDDAALRRARRALGAARADLAAVVNDVSPRLSAAAVAERLQAHQDAVLEVVDAAARRSTATYDLLRRAGAATSELAKVLAAAVARQFPERFAGSATAAAAELRAELTGQLTAHEHLLGASIAAGASAGTQSRAFGAARAALGASTGALADTVEGVWGKEAGARFEELWRGHVEAFVAYTAAQSSRDRPGAAAQRKALDGFRSRFGAFIAGESRELPAAGVAEALAPYVEATTAVARAAVKGSPKTFERLRTASGELPELAAVLADGIARQYPEAFPAS